MPRPTAFLFGTPGLTRDGQLPETFEGQAEQAWKNVFALLERAGMGPEHLVKITQYLVRAEDLPLYPPVRTKWLQNHRPRRCWLSSPALCGPTSSSKSKPTQWPRSTKSRERSFLPTSFLGGTRHRCYPTCSS
ncbi:RidA family protein [Tunturiibacter gelidiferens]|uniref:RidA family protein n=1 Tax=Tunturiibacter gelidiferens TaxID=3069689 RepID=UPI003D9BA838